MRDSTLRCDPARPPTSITATREIVEPSIADLSDNVGKRQCFACVPLPACGIAEGSTASTRMDLCFLFAAPPLHRGFDKPNCPDRSCAAGSVLRGLPGRGCGAWAPIEIS